MFINGRRRYRGYDDAMIEVVGYVKITQKAYINDKCTEKEKEDLIERMKDHIWNAITTITRESINPVITMKKVLI